jgi:AcrR family transcriptional regulator
MTYKQGMGEVHSLQPASRAMREPGRRMRSRLLDAAVAAFEAKGLNGASVAEIAAAAGAFPSQVTYYFRTKEALFVEAACREVLYVARKAEQAGAQATSARDYQRRLANAVIGSTGLVLFVDALTLARRRQDLAPQIERTFERLYAEGTRAYADLRGQRGWSQGEAAAVVAHRFWTLALGVALGNGATGATDSVEEMLGLLRNETADNAAEPRRDG